MSIGILFIVIFIVGFIITAIYLSVSRQQDNTPPVKPADIDWDAVNDESVQSSLARNNKIEAIKRYRLLTGQGLKEAKDAIDYATLHPDERGDKKKKATYDAQDAGIRDLVKDGRLDEAVEVYQKFAGVDAYTAKDAVADIARDLHHTVQEVTFADTPVRKTNNN